MSRADDYLWDRRSADGDGRRADVAELQRLERLLAGFQHGGGEPPVERLPKPRTTPRRWPLWLLAVAALLLVAFLLWPDDALRPGAGRRSFVAGSDPVAVQLGSLATLTIEPGSELRFDHWRTDEARFALLRGALTARVARPPAVPKRFLVVDTPLGRIVDEGCRFAVRIAADGRERIEVSEGAVSVASGGRTVYVPAGACTEVTRKGPSIPWFGDASPRLRDVTRKLAGMSAQSPFRTEAAREVVRACRRPSDALALWHLLRDSDPDVRVIAERALLDRFGPPAGDPGGGRTGFTEQEWLGLLTREAFPPGR